MVLQLEKPELYDFYINQNLSTVDIANIKSTNSKEICRCLNKFDIPTRSKSEAVKLTWSQKKRFYNTKNKTGKESPSWRGGRHKRDGYVMVFNVEKQEYEGEHRLVWKKYHGEIPKDFVVHHLNGIRNDNRIENLAALPKKEHPRNTFTKELQKRIKFLEKQLRGV